MSVLFSPFGNQQFSASGTALAVGHKLYTYAAGSSTPLATYTDSTGATPQTNPIILNSLGMPTNGQIWLTSGLSYKFVWKDASDVEIKTEDDITGVTGTASVSQWQASGLTPTYVSATSFTLSGDQTSEFHVGRRLLTTNTSGSIYSRISASAYGALTTVTVVNDSGVLDSGLSAVSYGLLTATNSSVPYLTRAYAAYTANAALTATIPFDNSKPQITEGTEILSVSITPKAASSRIRLRFQGIGVLDAATQGFTVALFHNSTADAIAAAMTVEFANQQFPAVLEIEHVPGATTAQTYTIRVGAQTNQCRFNGTIAATLGGGASAATLIAEEISV